MYSRVRIALKNSEEDKKNQPLMIGIKKPWAFQGWPTVFNSRNFV